MARMPFPWKKNSKPKKSSPAELLGVRLPEDEEARSESSLIPSPSSSRSSSANSSLENYEEHSIGTPEWYIRSKMDFESKWESCSPSIASRPRPNINEFQIHRKLASGNFGPIVLVQHRATREFYALKVLEKRMVVQRKQIDKAITEKKILESTNFPFLVSLHYSCQDSNNLYLIMDFVSGADLWSLLQRQRQRPTGRRILINEVHIKFYISQILLALEYLHFVDLVYRDLKPENILLDSSGYLKLADFGYTKRLGRDNRLWTFCGTQDYIAPEIILGKPYSKAVDFWALGVLIYEMITGVTPFYHAGDKMLTYECIVSGRYKEPSYVSKELKDLMRKLMQVDLTRRLGCLKEGISGLKRHPWFASINWTEILQKQVQPPYVPKLSHSGDTRYFSTDSKVNNNDVGLILRRESHPTLEDPYMKYFQDF